MIVGIPKEIKTEEYRAGIVPEGVKLLRKNRHEVLIEKDAGIGSGFSDEDYKSAGADITSADEVWKSSDMVMKAKDPLEIEFQYFRPELIIYTFLHLGVFPELTEALQKSRVTAIDYANIHEIHKTPRILEPMSEIAGKLAVQKGAYYLEKMNGGKGILLGPDDAEPARVLILGGGISGINAATIALGMGAKVTLIEKRHEKCKELWKFFREKFGDQVWEKFNCYEFDHRQIKNTVGKTDLLIGAVRLEDEAAPKIISEEMVKAMEPGSVIIDISIDEGGCVETSRPTSHKDPVFVKHGVIHYCVTNMPGIVPRTSTIALTKQSIPFALEIANKGFKTAIRQNVALRNGVNVYKGEITHRRPAKVFNKKYVPVLKLL